MSLTDELTEVLHPLPRVCGALRRHATETAQLLCIVALFTGFSHKMSLELLNSSRRLIFSAAVNRVEQFDVVTPSAMFFYLFKKSLFIEILMINLDVYLKSDH